MSEIDERLAAMSSLFAEHADSSADAIGNAHDADDTETLKRLCHSLSGRAAMFGHANIGDAARSIELALDEGQAPVSLTSEVNYLVAGLRSLSADSPASK